MIIAGLICDVGITVNWVVAIVVLPTAVAIALVARMRSGSFEAPWAGHRPLVRFLLRNRPTANWPRALLRGCRQATKSRTPLQRWPRAVIENARTFRDPAPAHDGDA